MRRLKEQVRDLDIIATASDPAALTEYFTQLPWVEEIVAKGNTKATVVSNEGLRFDLRVVPPESYGNLLQHFTGSKAHNVALREEAVRKKLSISEYGIQDTESGDVFTDKTEEAMYKRLGYPWIPPELGRTWASSRPRRSPPGARRAGRHPRRHAHALDLVSSDGKNTIEEMAQEAKRPRPVLPRRHRPLALPREGRLEAQIREIDSVQEKLGRFKLLKGSRPTSGRPARLTSPTTCSRSGTGSWPRSTPASTRTT